MNNEQVSLEPLRKILFKILTDPHGAADDLEEMASKLLEAAKKLRAGAAGGIPTSPGGMGDRVQMNLIGPDGKVKSTHTAGGI
jgi:hypothetical protein